MLSLKTQENDCNFESCVTSHVSSLFGGCSTYILLIDRIILISLFVITIEVVFDGLSVKILQPKQVMESAASSSMSTTPSTHVTIRIFDIINIMVHPIDVILSDGLCGDLLAVLTLIAAIVTIFSAVTAMTGATS